MSASSKKKLRKEQEAAKMTEKQLNAQKEARKTSLYTTAFLVVMAVILVIAIVVGVNQTITNSGIREKNTVALTVGNHKISNAEMNYYFMDSVNEFYSAYGSYAAMFGLDVTAPLDQQVLDAETGLTWADDFLSAAKSNAQATYALADAAEAAGFALSNEERTAVEYNVYNIDAYANLYGFESGDAYMKALYGNGASVESYEEYALRTALADAYYNHYAESLTYEEADLRAKDAENPSAYNSYSFNSYYMSVSKFQSEDATDADKEAAVKAAEAAAKELVSDEITTIEELDAAIAALSINEGTTAASSASTTLYASLNSVYADWVSDSSRKAGDKAYFASTSIGENGEETVLGYYVIYFNGSDDNTVNLANVRHILVAFAHDESEDHDHTAATYTDAEKAAAKASAEELLAQWESGDKSEDSFAELANSVSDDGDGVSGGLYENVYPGQMVTNFNDWCFDSSRKTGDTDIVETEYGYHIMYYVGQSETTYRDFMIENDLRSTDVSEWYNAAIEAATVTDGDFKYVNTGAVLSAA